ncbi:serine/threonine protein kinase [Phytophthora cinnamomi]|uniref:serine/threonine protein kinase n=1 Tax=Phytophthora cinnamomi TaxID=4785 RepID=UPI00355AC972|nr:serine/threonine protein kinase [Phytophthora cinnamomi]
MTATLLCARRSNRSDGSASNKSSSSNGSNGSNGSSTGSSNAAAAPRQRHIKVSSRLAPQIYLGHVYRSGASASSSPSSSPSSPSPASPPPARPVVVKCAGQLRRDQAGRLQGPWKEWQAARQLRGGARRHPNVVQVFDTFVQRAHVFVVMEHCARGDLLTHLGATQPESRLDQRRALRIVLHLARGLRFLHEACNIAHRDVSLENVFVTRDGVYKLGDFGLSTRADRRASGCVGKPQYVAPEVVAQRSYDPVAADVWSLGVLLFMLLTGAPLLEFAAPGSPELRTVRAVGCRGVLRSWHMDAQLAPETMDLLDKMLQFDPACRLQSMRAVLAHPALLAASRQEDADADADAEAERGDEEGAAKC